jgi:hypothetical protein
MDSSSNLPVLIIIVTVITALAKCSHTSTKHEMFIEQEGGREA